MEEVYNYLYIIGLVGYFIYKTFFKAKKDNAKKKPAKRDKGEMNPYEVQEFESVEMTDFEVEKEQQERYTELKKRITPISSATEKSTHKPTFDKDAIDNMRKMDEELSIKSKSRKREISKSKIKSAEIVNEEMSDEEAFDLRQAVINKVILDRPYID